MPRPASEWRSSTTAHEAVRSRRRTAGRRRLAVAGAALATLIALVVVAVILITAPGKSGPPPLPLPGIGQPAKPGDPFAYVADREPDFVARATAGSDHVLFVKSPGGVLATAARVSALRPEIDRAVAGTAIDPSLVEALVFVESAGRPSVIAGADPADAAGLTQILAQTGPVAARHARRPRAQPAPDRPDRRRVGAWPGRPRRASATGARQHRRSLRPAQGAGRDGPLPGDRRAALRRDGTSRSSPTTWGSATCRPCSTTTTQDARCRMPSSTSTPRPTTMRPPSRSSRGSATTPRSTTGACSERSGSCACTGPTGPRWSGSSPCRPRPTRTPRSSILRPATAPSPAPMQLDRAYATRAILPLPANAASLGLRYDAGIGALAHRLGFTPALYRGLRPPALDLLIALAARVRALSQRPEQRPDRDQRGERHALSATARRGRPAGGRRLVVHDRPPLRRPLAGRRLPGDARPPAGAGPDRLGAVSVRDRDHRRVSTPRRHSCTGHDRRHPHPGRASRRPARLSVRAQIPPVRRTAPRAPRRGRTARRSCSSTASRPGRSCGAR